MMAEDGSAFSGLDASTMAVLEAANISMDMLPSLSKKDLRDLFPGPEHFLRRRAIWRTTHGENEKPVKKQLLNRVKNVATSKNKQRATSSRRRRQVVSFESSSLELPTDDSGSIASTLIFERSSQSGSSSREAEQVDGPEATESLRSQLRHFKALQKLYKSRPKPNRKDVAQLLDLEFQARRAYIESDVVRGSDKPTKVLNAYPCFREVDHLMDELQRILTQGKSNFIPELKSRWGDFWEKIQFYGVFKKVLTPPVADKVKQAVVMMKTLPEIFPSPVAPPKKMRHASEGMLHILEPEEDPDTFLQTRRFFSPVVIVCENNCILAIGDAPVLIFPKEDISESLLYIMACYYTFHLTYPTCLATLLSMVQTEVLMEAIDHRDMTSSYKRAVTEWRKFFESAYTLSKC